MRGGPWVQSGSDGADDMRQQVRWRGMVFLAIMAVGCVAKRGVGGGSAHGGEARMRGAWVSGGVNDPDVCGLWFQESLPLYGNNSFCPLFLFTLTQGSALILMVGPFD
jgi:hypothetical protein